MLQYRNDVDFATKEALLNEVMKVVNILGKEKLGKSNSVIDAILLGIAKNTKKLKKVLK